MHESVSSNGTPRRAPSSITCALCSAANGAATVSACARPRDRASAIAVKKAGVASGNGLPASGPSTMRRASARAATMPALASSVTLRPTRYTSVSGVS